jgi:hypothetical protein
MQAEHQPKRAGADGADETESPQRAASVLAQRPSANKPRTREKQGGDPPQVKAQRERPFAGLVEMHAPGTQPRHGQSYDRIGALRLGQLVRPSPDDLGVDVDDSTKSRPDASAKSGDLQ